MDINIEDYQYRKDYFLDESLDLEECILRLEKYCYLVNGTITECSTLSDDHKKIFDLAREKVPPIKRDIFKLEKCPSNLLINISTSQRISGTDKETILQSINNQDLSTTNQIENLSFLSFNKKMGENKKESGKKMREEKNLHKLSGKSKEKNSYGKSLSEVLDLVKQWYVKCDKEGMERDGKRYGTKSAAQAAKELEDPHMKKSLDYYQLILKKAICLSDFELNDYLDISFGFLAEGVKKSIKHLDEHQKIEFAKKTKSKEYSRKLTRTIIDGLHKDS